jgi:hypothetical protein
LPPDADAMHALLMIRADKVSGCAEGSVEATELETITDTVERYEAVACRSDGWRQGLVHCCPVMNILTSNEKPPLRAVSQVLIALLLSACGSTSSGNIIAQHVPPERYQGLTCWEIGAEGERVASRVAEISGDEHSAASGASWFVAQSVVVLWPTPWLANTEEGSTDWLATTAVGTTELSKLRGEFEALEQASERKRCGLSFKQQAR